MDLDNGKVITQDEILQKQDEEFISIKIQSYDTTTQVNFNEEEKV